MINKTLRRTGAYSELVTSYDKNGNIKALKRNAGSSSLAGDLTYTYSGNRITKVKDTAGNSGLFKDGSTATTEYTYDNNGNLKSDLNKGISKLAVVVKCNHGELFYFAYRKSAKMRKTFWGAAAHACRASPASSGVTIRLMNLS